MDNEVHGRYFALLHYSNSPLRSSTRSSQHDIANYKTLLYRTTLDIGAMTDFSAGDLGNFTTLVIGGVENGKSFDQISSTSDLSGSVLQVTGNKVKSGDDHSTGRA